MIHVLDVVGGISPPAYTETNIPDYIKVLVVIGIIAALAIFFALVLFAIKAIFTRKDKHKSKKSSEKCSEKDSNEEETIGKLSEEEEELIKEFRKRNKK